MYIKCIDLTLAKCLFPAAINAIAQIFDLLCSTLVSIYYAQNYASTLFNAMNFCNRIVVYLTKTCA